MNIWQKYITVSRARFLLEISLFTENFHGLHHIFQSVSIPTIYHPITHRPHLLKSHLSQYIISFSNTIFSIKVLLDRQAVNSSPSLFMFMFRFTAFRYLFSSWILHLLEEYGRISEHTTFNHLPLKIFIFLFL